MGIFAVGVAASLVTFVLQCSGCCLLERDSAGHVRRVRLGVGNNRARLARQSLQSECIDRPLACCHAVPEYGPLLGTCWANALSWLLTIWAEAPRLEKWTLLLASHS